MAGKAKTSKKSRKAARFDRRVRRIVRDELARTPADMGIDPERPMTPEQAEKFEADFADALANGDPGRLKPPAHYRDDEYLPPRDRM